MIIPCKKNNKRAFYALLLFLYLFTVGGEKIYAQNLIPTENQYDDYDSNEYPYTNKKNEVHEREGPLRRFEISFFISLPFVFILNFIALHLTDVMIEKESSVNVWKNHGPFLAINSLIITSIVSIKEARLTSKQKNSNTQNITERTLYVFYNYKF